MLGIIGTVPDPNLPLLQGPVRLEGDRICIEDHLLPVHRCTPALLAAALKAAEFFNGPEVYAFLIGDTGRGEGSRLLYRYLSDHLAEYAFEGLTFHYLQPDVDWHNKVLFAVEAMSRRPLLIADAGFMYAAKMSGQAESYDFFTPDAGELAFLADEHAPHPFYTRGFILHENNQVQDLIHQAYAHHNAASYLLVKGAADVVADAQGIISSVDQPSHPALEAIGGTGDTLTGLLSVLCAFGYEPARAAELAARVNRWTGALANPTPATQVSELIHAIPRALASVFSFAAGKAEI